MVTFGQAIKASAKPAAQPATRRSTKPPTPSSTAAGTGSFNDILTSLNKIKKSNVRSKSLLPPIPAVKHHPSLSHIQEVIQEGKQSSQTLWMARRQFEFVSYRQTGWDLAKGSFFWSHRGIMPSSQYTGLQLRPRLEEKYSVLSSSGDKEECIFRETHFELSSNGEQIPFIEVCELVQDKSQFREVSRRFKTGQYAIGRNDSNEIIYCEKLLQEGK